MSKGTLKPDIKAKIEGELGEFTLMHDYLSKSSPNEEITAIERRKEFVLLDGGIKVPKILMIKNSSGVTQILNSFSQEYTADEINEVATKTGLTPKDIGALMQDGMELSEIQDAAVKLPFRDIAESSAIREMIRQRITPEQLSKMDSRGITIENLPNGGIKQNILTKIAEVEPTGKMKFDEEWFEKNLRPFAELRLIDASEELVVKDEQQKSGSLEAISLNQKREEKTKEEIQKAKVAKAFGIESEEILSIIRIEDRVGGSKLFNYELKNIEKPLIVRLKNNKFRVVKESENGEISELIGVESTPVSKEVAFLLKNTPGAYSTLEKGEVKAGKTNVNQAEYNIFQIRRAGESIDDDSNNLLFVGCCGETDMNIIESRDNGEVRFAKPPQSSIYPESIYLEDNSGTNQKRELTGPQADNSTSYISIDDIEKRRETLARLLEVDEEIDMIENPENYPPKDTTDDKEKEDISDLYSERAQLLAKLELKESEMLKAEEEYGPTRRMVD